MQPFMLLPYLCSEIQFRQVAGDFERFQGKWMLQGISSNSLSSGSSSDGEVRTCMQRACALAGE